MEREERKRRARAAQAKVSLSLGGIGLMISWVYGAFFYGNGHPQLGTGKNPLNVLLDLAALARQEPLGAAIVLVSVLLLLFGVIQFRRSRD